MREARQLQQAIQESEQTVFLKMRSMGGQQERCMECILKMGVPGHHLIISSESWWSSPKNFNALTPAAFVPTKVRERFFRVCVCVLFNPCHSIFY